MYVYMDLYRSFTCIGSDCVESCCATGWKIPLVEKVVEYYQKVEGEFGDFLRQNMYWDENKQRMYVKLTERNECPFLMGDGLCRIYIECGEEWMSEACRIFPRMRLDLGGNSMRGLSMSCEEVLRMLYVKRDPVCLRVEGVPEVITLDDISFWERSQFIGWGMEMLQNETIPFGVSLATVIHTALQAEGPFRELDFESFEAVLLQADETQKEFLKAEKELSKELEECAWKLLFGVTDTFCLILKEAEPAKGKQFLWKTEMFEKDDRGRRDFLVRCWKKQRKTSAQRIFMRRAAAAFFQNLSMAFGIEDCSFYIRDLCNYLILSELLPVVWEEPPQFGTAEYFSRLRFISTLFEQSGVIKQFVWPVIENIFHPDLFSYAAAFMVLFDS